MEYARYADDLVILIDGNPWHRWLVPAVQKRLLEELAKLDVQVNSPRSYIIRLRVERELSRYDIRPPW